MTDEREIPELHRRWLERPGLIEVGRVPMRDAWFGMIRSVPTMHHAARVFESVERGLGDRGWRDPGRPEAEGALHVRDPERRDWAFAVPIVEMAFAGTTSLTVATFRLSPDAKPGPPPVDADIVPTGPMMRAGELVVREGASFFKIEYDERGVARGSCRSASEAWTEAYLSRSKPCMIDLLARPPSTPPLSILCRADMMASGYALERFAELLRAIDPARHVAARILVPARTPLFANGLLSIGIGHLRRALFDGVVPADARWAVADAFDGAAITWGSGADEAIANWKEQLFRKKPRPPEPTPVAPSPPPKPEAPKTYEDEQGRTIGVSTGTITISATGGGEPVPWPRAVPANVPGVLVPIASAPESVPGAWMRAGFREWKRVVGAMGGVDFALAREDRVGWTLVGRGVADVADPERIDAEIDASETRESESLPEGFPNPWKDEAVRTRIVSYRCFDDLARAPMRCKQVGGQFHGGMFDASQLDGDAVTWGITRVWQRA